MNTDLETIENYLTGQLASDRRQAFEDALRTDPAVADAVAFYVLTKRVARHASEQAQTKTEQPEAREQRRAELDALRKKDGLVPDDDERAAVPIPDRPRWNAPVRWVAAASVILLLSLGWYFIDTTHTEPTATQLADQYISAHFTQLPTKMDAGASGSTSEDSLRLGVALFNKGELIGAETIFHGVLTRHPRKDAALKYAGIVSLRRGNYDQAIVQFHHLSELADLMVNPGLFYEAIAHIKRGQPLDQAQAKQLLNEVIAKNTEGRGEAETLLNQLN